MLGGKSPFQRHLDPGHRFAAVAERGADTFADDAVTIRIQRAEAEILQLGLELVHAQALRDRCVDLQRLARDAATRFAVLGPQRTHVVQAVGELDQDHAQVARHRQQHLAEAFRVGFLATAELHLVQLGDAVDQLGHGVAEFACELGATQPGVLERVVQDRGDDGFGVQAELGEDMRHRHRVRDVWLAGFARLSGVGFGADHDKRGARARPGPAAGRCLPVPRAPGRKAGCPRQPAVL